MHLLCERILQGYRPKLDEFIHEFGTIFSLLNQLHDTPQDPEWHAEGNVYIHTSYVLEELYSLIDIEGKHLSPYDVLSLILAAVFHDIAKPITTREMEIKGKIRIAAPRHEYIGGSYIAYKLAVLNLPFNVIYNIISLVIHHVTPKLLVVKNAPKNKYYKLANVVNVELLYFLEKADMLGRICKDKVEQIGHIELFKLFCQEYNIWPNIDPYKNISELVFENLPNYSSTTKNFVISKIIKDLENGIINHPLEGIAKSFSYRESFSEVFILSGPSGAGKSTWVEKNLQDYEIISLDKLREQIAGKQSDQSHNGQVLQAAKKLLKQHLAKKNKIVWDATNLRKDFRGQIVELCYAYHAYVTLVVFYCSEDSFYSRNKNRTNRIPENILEKQFRKFEWPESHEAHSYSVVNEDGEYIFRK